MITEATTIAVEGAEAVVEVVATNPGAVARVTVGGANLISRHPIGAAIVGTAVLAGGLYGTYRLWQRKSKTPAKEFGDMVKDQVAAAADAVKDATSKAA